MKLLNEVNRKMGKNTLRFASKDIHQAWGMRLDDHLDHSGHIPATL
jgi:hypothetical protein